MNVLSFCAPWLGWFAPPRDRLCEPTAEQRRFHEDYAPMPLDRYDWSERYGWMSDRYGLSWKIMLGRRADVHEDLVSRQCGRGHG